MALTPSQFYAESHRGTAFGVVDKLHPNGHSGFDFNEWPEGTRIPAVWPGRVARRGSTSNFGNWISVYIGGPDRLYLHYCHLRDLSTAPTLGRDIPVGGDSGPLGNTGYSKGNHLHLMCSTSDNPEAYAGVRDPMPFVNATLTAAGGGGSGSAGTGGSDTINPPTVKGTPLFISPLVYNDANKVQHQYDPPRYVIVSEAGGCTVADTATVEGQALMGQLNRQGFWAQPDSRTIYLSAAQLIANALRPPATVTSLDAAELAAAVDAALADDFAAVKENIDDQPTEFKVSPA